MVVTISSSSGVGSVSSLDRRADADQVNGDTAGLTGATFDALLTVSRIMSAATHGRMGDRAAPSQMFEPNQGDAGAQRQAHREADARSERIDASSDGQLDRTSVRARQAAQRTSDQSDGNGRSPQRFAGDMMRSVDRTTTQARAHLASELRGLVESDRADAPTLGDALATSRGRGSGGATISSALRADASPTTSSRPDSNGTLATAVSVVKPAVAEGGTSDQNPARDVAKLLSVARGTGSESGRAAGAHEAAANERAPGGSRRPEGQASRSGASDSSASTSRGERAREGVGEAEKSPFDQLVRSMRLRTAARHSSARLHLDPPELGRMRVDVRIAGDNVRIDIRTETVRAKELLQERADKLVSALREQGIHVERLEVNVNSTTDSHDQTREDHGLSAHDEGDRTNPERHESVSPGSRTDPTQETGESTAMELLQESATAAETRLDIRI